MLRSSLPLAALFLVALEIAACRPEAEPSGRTTSSVSTDATSSLPPLLDPAPPREIAIGNLFSPDGSIQAPDRKSLFARGALIFLSVESDDLPSGTSVIVDWTAPDGAVTNQRTTAIGGESYLSYTAPSAGWTLGAGRVGVQIGEPSRETRREIPFKIAPSLRTEPTPKPTPAPEP
ncbi:MAG: hypothetical protein ABJC13_16820 [Acidobacteriota bacterium]